MDGMGFLLNSLGIDPDEIKNAASQVQATAKDFLARLDRIEVKLDKVLTILQEVEATSEQHSYLRLENYDRGSNNSSGDGSA